MALITYEDAIRHLKLEGAEPDVQDVQLKMETATAVVVALIDNPTVTDAWTVGTEGDTTFNIAQGFMFKVLQRQDRFRGDDEDGKHMDWLTQSEQQLLVNLIKDHITLA